MATIGQPEPTWRALAYVKGEQKTIGSEDFRGKWHVLYWYPLDFTFVCPTELAEFNHRLKDFRDRDAQVLGISNDSHFVHLAWRNAHPDLKDLGYPMLADNKKDGGCRFTLIIPHKGAS